jgi:hypothetical protein
VPFPFDFTTLLKIFDAAQKENADVRSVGRFRLEQKTGLLLEGCRGDETDECAPFILVLVSLLKTIGGAVCVGTDRNDGNDHSNKNHYDL